MIFFSSSNFIELMLNCEHSYKIRRYYVVGRYISVTNNVVLHITVVWSIGEACVQPLGARMGGELDEREQGNRVSEGVGDFLPQPPPPPPFLPRFHISNI